MNQHEDSDEDDYEGYFLKPVNGYNIADRIKSANKELFEGDIGDQPEDFTEPLRKVSFRPEPDFEPSEPELDDNSSCDDEDVEAINQVLDRRDEIIAFEQNGIEIESNEVGTKERMSNGGDVTGADDEIEEICEYINNVDLAESPTINENEKIADEVQTLPTVTFLRHDDVLHTNGVLHNDDGKSSEPTSTSIQSINSKNSECATLQPSQPKSNSAKVKRSESVQQQHHRHHHHNHRPAPPSVHTKNSSESQFLKIQLNFKPCCEYKYLENDRLPRYCGYISQYGLSKEQLEIREKRKERLKERQSDKTAKQLQEESMKSEVNEEAFARWLQNKMRTSRSMTKNMYDYRPSKHTKNGKKKI